MTLEQLGDLIEAEPRIARDWMLENGADLLAERLSFSAATEYWAHFFRTGKGHPDYRSIEEMATARVWGQNDGKQTIDDVWGQASAIVDWLVDS